MAQLINIDTDDNLDQVTKVILDGNLYVFRLRYNDRSGWQLGIYDPDIFNNNETDHTAAKLYGERKLMPNQNFFKYTHGLATLPTGYLFLHDTDFPDKYNYKLPERYDLGQDKRFVLVYFSKEEYDELVEEL